MFSMNDIPITPELDLFTDDQQDIEIETVSDAELERLLHRAGSADRSSISVSVPVVVELCTELLDLRNAERDRETHLNHCNIWPYENSCKYGSDADCPALRVYVSVDALAQALYSAEGGRSQVDGGWQDDLVRESFQKRASQLLDLLIGQRRG